MKGIVQRSPNTEVNRAIIGTEVSLDRIEGLMEKLSTSTEKLVTSVDSLSQSSKQLEDLTRLLIFLTLLLAVLTVFGAFLEGLPFFVKVITVSATFIIFFYFEFKDIKSRR